MAIPPPIIPVPELIRADRTSGALHVHAIPNAAIPSSIKTTAHTCELIAFKPLTRSIASPVSRCTLEMPPTGGNTSRSEDGTARRRNLGVLQRSSTCSLCPCFLLSLKKIAPINASREMCTLRQEVPRWSRLRCRNATEQYWRHLGSRQYLHCLGLRADELSPDCPSP